MRPLSIALVLLAGASLAQGRPAPSPDGGVSADAGVAEAPRPVPAAARAQADAEVQKLHREIAELKALVERQGSQTDAMAAALEKVSKQVTALRTDLTENEQRRLDEQQKAADRRAATSRAVAGLAYAQQQLATGSANVGDALRAAEVAFSGSALWAVQAARAALANGDLASARIWLAIAASEANTPGP